MIHIRIRCDHCGVEQRWSPSDGQPATEILRAIREATGISRVALDVGHDTRVMDLCERCIAMHGDASPVDGPPTYRVQGEAIECLKCGKTSHHPGDVVMRYCAHCDWMHDEGRPRSPLDVETYRRRIEEGGGR